MPKTQYREFSRERGPEFLARGLPAGDFFPHRVYFLPKCGPDAVKLAEWMCGEAKGCRLFEVILHAAEACTKDFPDELFHDMDLIWHQQHFGLNGHIAFAYLYLKDDQLYGLNYVSDLVQRISRRRVYKTRVEKTFRGWVAMLVNSILAFAVENRLKTVYSPTADLVMSHTDPKRFVHRELFHRVYDRTLQKQFLARREGPWWVVDVAENQHKVVLGLRRIAGLPDDDAICVCHDIEKGLGHDDVDPEFAAQANRTAPDCVERMLAIEGALDLRTTYHIVGLLFGEFRAKIEQGGHCVAFHSFDHKISRGQLGKCRQVDYRVRGYRAPRSEITEELEDSNLCRANFDWLASSAPSFNTRLPAFENGIVKIPVLFDDFPLYQRQMNYEQWERKLLKFIGTHGYVSLGLHDCYGAYWLSGYSGLLRNLMARGRLETLDNVANRMILQKAV